MIWNIDNIKKYFGEKSRGVPFLAFPRLSRVHAYVRINYARDSLETFAAY